MRRPVPALTAAALLLATSSARGDTVPAVLDLTDGGSRGAPGTSLRAPIFSAIPVMPITTLIEQAAISKGVPPALLLKLLRRESALNPGAVSHKGAQGIAQFMPRTALERGLADPFDPGQAVPKAAELLRDLRDRYGSWGLATAAYNAGPGRVSAWLAGRSGLPQETTAYVASVTGIDAATWATVHRLPTSVWLLGDPWSGGSPQDGSTALPAASMRPKPAPAGREKDRNRDRDRTNGRSGPCAALLSTANCIVQAKY